MTTAERDARITELEALSRTFNPDRVLRAYVAFDRALALAKARAALAAARGETRP